MDRESLSLMLYVPVFARSMWTYCTALGCTQTTLTPTHPPTQTCLGTHIDYFVPSEHMHTETPTWSSYEPSLLMFMHQLQSKRGQLLYGIISNVLPLYVGEEYVNGRFCIITVCRNVRVWTYRYTGLWDRNAVGVHSGLHTLVERGGETVRLICVLTPVPLRAAEQKAEGESIVLLIFVFQQEYEYEATRTSIALRRTSIRLECYNKQNISNPMNKYKKQ